MNSETICEGTSVVLNANGASTYIWSPSSGLSSTSGNSVTANPISTTTYTITGTDASGCSSSTTSTVTVSPSPIVTVNSATICEGSNVNLTANGASTYSWSPSTGLSSSSGSVVTASPNSTTTYTVTGSIGSCFSTANSTVTVNPIPTVSASNNGPLCSGQILNLTASGNSGATYSWTGPNGFTSNLQNPTITNVANSNVGTYTVTIILNGCSSTATTTFALIPGLSSNFNPAGPFCVNDNSIQLVAQNPGGVWSGSGITNTTNGTFSPASAFVGSNSVTYTIAGGCGGPTTQMIIVNALPIVNFSASDLSGCTPLNTILTDNSVPSSTTLEWDFGDGTTSNSLNSVSHTYSNIGCYTVSLTTTATTGCSNSLSSSNFICVVPSPNASFGVNSQVATLTDPNFQFLNQSTNATSFSWNFGDGTTSNEQNPAHSFNLGAGNYQVELIAFNSDGCSDTTRMIVSITDELVFFIPNSFSPNGDEHNNVFQPIFTSGFDPFSFNISIFNRWGETVFESNNSSIGWDGSYQGKIVSEGVYTWIVRFKGSESDKKFEFNGSVMLIK